MLFSLAGVVLRAESRYNTEPPALLPIQIKFIASLHLCYCGRRRAVYFRFTVICYRFVSSIVSSTHAP